MNSNKRGRKSMYKFQCENCGETQKSQRCKRCKKHVKKICTLCEETIEGINKPCPNCTCRDKKITRAKPLPCKKRKLEYPLNNHDMVDGMNFLEMFMLISQYQTDDVVLHYMRLAAGYVIKKKLDELLN